MATCITILPTKTTAAQSEDALSYHRVRGLYFLAVVFVRSICVTIAKSKTDETKSGHNTNIFIIYILYIY